MSCRLRFHTRNFQYDATRPIVCAYTSLCSVARFCSSKTTALMLCRRVGGNVRFRQISLPQWYRSIAQTAFFSNSSPTSWVPLPQSSKPKFFQYLGYFTGVERSSEENRLVRLFGLGTIGFGPAIPYPFIKKTRTRYAPHRL